MKKILMIALVLAVSVFVGVGSASALSYSSIGLGPEVFSGRTSQSGIIKGTSQAYSSVKGGMVHFEVTLPGYLRSGVCKASNYRYAVIDLWEDDVYPNEDEHFQTMIYTFSGLKLSSIKQDSIDVLDEGNIDSAGDPTVELYHTVYLSAIDGDTSATNGPLYKYRYTIE